MSPVASTTTSQEFVDDFIDMGEDPYRVLRLDRDASWEQIMATYKRHVRWWHPDGYPDASDFEHQVCEYRIRQLNVAFQELRVRRGR